ncbi:hypothetical protein [Corynebacterium cystitidis]|uniref:Uncharacterized protein n=1 Tax=Corynebacterium cystitidis DSM 20524 TaxID=1121357 RepID=A0A1H9UUL3_9CORY|nr:hypothetical protein [Corynebacterium cystitidis]WJY83705.1 hypothetical protein CCYS_14120 [Corynebacterium cystitidis DSM 20524]SES13112.1 hypothetical protein SAMN05661109_01935 [Corynebacterium cystitidis DSM 20524]SNV91228.1 Uncharacterised protein [Corynebacterium cystitidis]
MTWELMAFDPAAVPCSTYEDVAEWKNRAMHDPSYRGEESERANNFYLDLSEKFPAFNPDEADEEELDAMIEASDEVLLYDDLFVDYVADADYVYGWFGYGLAEKVEAFAREKAKELGLAYFDVNECTITMPDGSVLKK